MFYLNTRFGFIIAVRDEIHFTPDVRHAQQFSSFFDADTFGRFWAERCRCLGIKNLYYCILQAA